MKVELTYFKESGKYYSGGTFLVSDDCEMFEIFKCVRELCIDQNLPGLISPCGFYHVLVNVPEHKNNHPCLIPIQYNQVKSYIKTVE